MPLWLRKISKSRWYGHEAHPWLPNGSLEADAIQADAMSDLKTENNALSVWRINDDRTNLEQIIIALAAKLSKPTHLDYALFDQQFLVNNEFKIEQVPGETPCAAANSCHFHLTELSVHKLTEVAELIKGKAERNRCTKKETLALIKRAIDSGDISREGLDTRIVEAVKKLNT